MALVGLIDLAGLVACVAAFIILCAGRKGTLVRDVWFPLAALLVLTAFRSLSNALRGLGVTVALEPVADYMQLLEPALWAFLFYAFLQSTVQRGLRQSEERNRILLASLPQRIFFKDPDSALVFVNERLAQDLGLRPEDLVGKTDFDLYPRELAEKYRADDLRVMKSGRPETLTEKNIAAGVERTVEVVKAPVIDDDGQTIGLFGIFSDITERAQAERALRYRVEFERLISTMSTEFINLPLAQIDSGIDRALQAIGEFAGVDRSYLFQFYDGGTKMDNTHEWCAEGIEPHMQNLQGIAVDENLPWFAQRIRKLEAVHVPRVAALPPEAQAEREHFETRDIRSLIVAPMVFGGQLIGFLGFDSVREEKAWPEDTIALLKVVGETFANALQRKEAEEALRQSEERSRSLFESATEFIHMLDRHGAIMATNPATLDGLGYSADEMLGRPLTDFFTRSSRASFEQDFPILLQRGSHRQDAEIVCKDGSVITVDCLTSAIRDEQGEVTSIVAMQRDITESVKVREELRMLSLADALTGLNNRRGFFHLAEQQLRFANRSKSALLLLYADLDGLKHVNDAFGHKEGDLALIETANVLRETFRESDVIGRVGGDEFAVLAMAAGGTTADRIRSRIRQRVDARNAQEDRSYELSLSVGIAGYNPGDPCSLDELLARADALMYRDKRHKQNS